MTFRRYQWNPYSHNEPSVVVSPDGTPIQQPSKPPHTPPRPVTGSSSSEDQQENQQQQEAMNNTSNKPKLLSAVSSGRSTPSHEDILPAPPATEGLKGGTFAFPLSPVHPQVVVRASGTGGLITTPPKTPSFSRRSSGSGSSLHSASRGSLPGFVLPPSSQQGVTTPKTSQFGGSSSSYAGGTPLAGSAEYWIHKMQSATRDTQVEQAIPQVSPEVQLNMLDLILIPENLNARPCLLLELCLSVRGNVIFHLLESLLIRETTVSRSSCFNSNLIAASSPGTSQVTSRYLNAFCHHMKATWNEWAFMQSSTIAFTRIFAILPIDYQVHLAHFILGQEPGLVDLALHQFANFLLKDILSVAAQHPNIFDFVYEQLGAAYCRPDVFVKLSESRAGSHVLEGFLKTAPAPRNNQLCGQLLSTPQGLEAAVHLGWHRQGNYPLQAVLRALRSQQSPLFQRVLDTVIPQLQGSNYRRNLLKAAGVATNSTSASSSSNPPRATAAPAANAQGPQHPPPAFPTYGMPMVMPPQYHQVSSGASSNASY